ncbi:peptidoglycan-binding protein [Streptomyces sp. NPDC090106]|uniref:peptidoglycan-binding domain-containing protein n=1 Tax=Streptomyces sp. NPDC090106 TaxID=3365946 RepID=UPI003825397B
MSEQAGPVCPECGTARLADGTPACSCARLASEAHRAERTAAAAAAEDFDPVRIRPFVEAGEPRSADELVGDETPHRFARPPVPPPSLTEPAPHEPTDARDRRRHRILLATALGASTVVVLTGGFVGGLFWYDGPERDGSASGGVRAGLPGGSPSESASVSASPTPAGAATPKSPSPSATSASPTTAVPTAPTGTSTPTATSSGAAPTTSDKPTPTPSGSEDPVLRYGDEGAEVTELQLRLQQIGSYDGEADGVYDRQVENAVRTYQVTRVVLTDESGVYGAKTRASLEAETTEP